MNRELKILIPPLSEQKRIVSKLESIFTHIDSAKISLDKVMLLLKQYKQSVLKGSRVFRIRVEHERSSVAASSQNILTINQLAAVLKSLEVGYGRRVSRERNEEYMQDRDALYERCQVWADEFMPAAREEYSGLLSGEIANEEIPQIRAKTFAYAVPFIRVLAGCYSQWLKSHESWKPLAEFIRTSSIRQRDEYGLLASIGLVAPNGTALFARRQEMARAIDYIVKEAETAVETLEK